MRQSEREICSVNSLPVRGEKKETVRKMDYVQLITGLDKKMCGFVQEKMLALSRSPANILLFSCFFFFFFFLTEQYVEAELILNQHDLNGVKRLGR